MEETATSVETAAAYMRLIAFLMSCNGADPEAEHGEAERLLLEAWRKDGRGNLAELWEQVSQTWWYA